MKHLFGCGLLVIGMTLVGCGDDSGDAEHVPTGGNSMNPADPPGHWDPGFKPAGGCSYGYGEPCPKAGVDCSKGSCIHGQCVDGQNGASDYCICDDGYVGLVCAECAEGYAPSGLVCVPAVDACVGNDCVFGTCHTVGTQYECDCYTGYAGELCDECASGFHDEDGTCVPG